MAKYIEKVIPLVVDAEPFDPDPTKKHIVVALDTDFEGKPTGTGMIHQVDGSALPVRAGDMIVTYSDGQVKPMKADLFNATFRKATKSDAAALPSSTDPS